MAIKQRKRHPIIHEKIHTLLLVLSLSLLSLLTSSFNHVYAENLSDDTHITKVKLKVGEPIEGNIAIYNTIKIPITNLGKWLENPENDASLFVLHIDGTLFPGLVPTVVNNKSLQYDLKRTAKTKDAWKTVFSRRSLLQHHAEVSVTVRQHNAYVTGETKATMIIVKSDWLNFFFGASLLALIAFLFLAIKSDVLRVPGQQPSGKKTRKPYSLARTQMAFWFFTIILSYVFIWMITRDLSILTPTVLGLMGISAATGLGSAMMDSNKHQEKETYRNEMEDDMLKSEAEESRLETEIYRLSMLRNEVTNEAVFSQENDPLIQKKAALAAKQTQIEQARRAVHAQYSATEPRASTSFISDILSDDNGFSFHRVQMFGWTVVLITIFITSVSNILAMPDFDATLLGLMGISGATYLGFKLPNQQG